jgi:type IV secretion system protein VirB4
MNAHRLFSLALGPVALAFAGAGGREDLEAVRKLHTEHGQIWPEKWLEQRGLKDWGASWRRLYDMTQVKAE